MSTTTTTLALLQAAFPSKISLSSADVAKAANLKSAGSLRTLRARGSIDLQPSTEGGRNYDIRVVANWLDERNAPKKRGGRALRFNAQQKQLQLREVCYEPLNT